MKYRFKNRSTGMYFNVKSVEWLKAGIESTCTSCRLAALSQDNYLDLSKIGLTLEERKWLERKCPFFQSDYLDYLQSFRFNPSQVSIQFIPTKDDPRIGDVDIEIDGLWVETILWEVPLMALISEGYFKCLDTNWESGGQEGELIYTPIRGSVVLIWHTRTSVSERSTTFPWRLRRERVWDATKTGILGSKTSHRGAYSC